MDEEGLPFSREQNDELRGLSRRDSLKLLLKERDLSEAEIQSYLRRKNEFYLTAVARMTERDLVPGAKPLLSALKARRVPIAVASSSQNSRVILERLGIEGWFDAVVDGNDVQNAKPDPELFLKAAAWLRVPPKECVVVEDAPAGVEAARRAGMKAAGIGPPERLSRADRCYASLLQIKAADLLAL